MVCLCAPHVQPNSWDNGLRIKSWLSCAELLHVVSQDLAVGHVWSFLI